jgi:hypothetical protein
MTCNSIAILKEAETRGEQPKLIASGNGLTLWRFLSDGTEVVETNGEPVWDSDDGFRELLSEMSPTGL